MSDQNNHKQLLSRRDALKALIAAGGATALSNMPHQWEQPFVKVGTLPAFAQTSPLQYPFSNQIESIEFEGEPSSSFQVAVQQGWIIVAPTGTTINNSQANYIYPWIIGRPWLKIKRKFQVITPPGLWGALTIKIKIKFKFFSLPGFGSSNKPKNGTNFTCFIISGANLNLFQHYNSTFQINGNNVVCSMSVPALNSGFWPFFLSCTFPSNFTLNNGSSLFPGYYLGPGCYGNSLKSSFLK